MQNDVINVEKSQLKFDQFVSAYNAGKPEAQKIKHTAYYYELLQKLSNLFQDDPEATRQKHLQTKLLPFVSVTAPNIDKQIEILRSFRILEQEHVIVWVTRKENGVINVALSQNMVVLNTSQHD